jgi:hypothetical protein
LQLKVLFNCERVTMVLVDRFKKDLFRYIPDPDHPSRSKIESYPLEAGLAGHVAVSCHTVFIEKISDENRFTPSIDDPKSLKEDLHRAKQCLSVPIFAKTDRDDQELMSEKILSHSLSSLSSLPRAVV